MSDLWHFENDRTRIAKVCVGAMENNAYILICARTGAAAVVDAAAEPGRLLDALDGYDPQMVLTTHGHWDHVGASGIAEQLQVPFMIGAGDAGDVDVPGLVPLHSGKVRLGDLSIDVLETPGHTPGSICFATEGVVFTGDTLFPGGPGATGGSPTRFAQILDGIESLLFGMPDETLVLPGHGLDTTIGTERPRLAGWRDRGW